MRSNIIDISVQEEINHNKKYISEIESEIDETIHYLEESIRTKKYLMKQIEEMQK